MADLARPLDYLKELCDPVIGADGFPEDEERILRAAKRFFTKCDTEKSKHDRNWPTWYANVSGRIWRQQMLSKLPVRRGDKVQKRVYHIAANYSGYLIRQLVGWQSVRQPQFYVGVEGVRDYDLPLSTVKLPQSMRPDGKPEDPNDYLHHASSDMELVTRASWADGKYSQKMLRSLYDMNTFGCGVLKSYIDDVTYKPRVSSVPIWNILADPVSSSNENMWGMVECNVVRVADCTKHGARALKIMPGLTSRASHTAEDAERMLRGYSTDSDGKYQMIDHASSQADESEGPQKSGDRTSPLLHDTVTEQQFWMRDISGRTWHHYTIAGDVLLDYQREQELPYVDFRFVETENYWGMGAAGLLYPIEVAIELVLSLLLNSIRLTCFPSLVYEQRTFEGRKDIVALPGASLVTTNMAGDTVRWLQPPQIPQYVPEYLRFLIEYGQKLVGLEGLLAAQAQGRGAPMGIVNQMAENSTVVLRHIASRTDQQIETLLKVLTNQIVEANSAFFSSYALPPGLDGQGRRLIELPPGRFEVGVPSGEGTFVDRPLRFTVDLETGTTFSRVTQIEQMMWLYDKGLVDQQAVLEKAGVAGMYDIMARMSAKQSANIQQVNQIAQSKVQSEAQRGPTPPPSAQSQGAD